MKKIENEPYPYKITTQFFFNQLLTERAKEQRA